MTGNEGFDALANTMSMGTYKDSAIALKNTAVTPHDERDHYARFLTEDDHEGAADVLLKVLKTRSGAAQDRLHVGDDFPAHVTWLIEGILRLKQNDPDSAEETRKFIAACMRAMT